MLVSILERQGADLLKLNIEYEKIENLKFDDVKMQMGNRILITNFNILISLILKIYNKAVIFYQNKEDKQLKIYLIL